MMNLKKNQDGLVAIIVSMMFIIIISLVVMSFAFFMRREQQQVLDRQLSTQAFYAAESGVNDYVVKLIESESIGSDDCANDEPEKVGESNAFYTCVIVDQTVPDIKYTNVLADESRLVRLTSNTLIHSIDINWESVDSKGIFASNQAYYLPTDDFIEDPGNSQTFARHVAVIDAMVIPIGDIDAVDRPAINGAAKAFFAYPAPLVVDGTNIAASLNYGSPAADGAFVGGGCDAANPKAHGGPYECETSITNLGGVRDVVVRVKPLYKNANITIVARGADGNPVSLIGAQAEIDSTGRANDVLRRIQVRVPLQGKQDYFPEFVLESGDDICKLLRIKIDSGEDLCQQQP